MLDQDNRKSDDGEYTCRLENRYGAVQHTIRVQVSMSTCQHMSTHHHINTTVGAERGEGGGPAPGGDARPARQPLGHGGGQRDPELPADRAGRGHPPHHRLVQVST